MGKTAQDKAQLESLLYGTPSPSAVQSTSTKSKTTPQSEPVVSDTVNVEDVAEPQPIFEFDYDEEMTKLRKQAKETVTSLVKHILPQDIISDDYIQDKIKQDISALAELLWARRSNELMKNVVMNIIANGNTTPRYFDNYSSLCDRIAGNNKQIIETENNLRKTYMDLKYEVQRKREEEISSQPLSNMISAPKVMEVIEAPKPITKQELTSTGAKSILNAVKEKQRLMMAEKMVSAEDVNYTEVQ